MNTESKTNEPRADSVQRVVRHDMTNGRWGWNLLQYCPAADRKSAKAMFIGRGVRDGHEIVIGFRSGNRVFRASQVEYSTNPTDLFECILTPVPNAEAKRPEASNE